MTFSFWLADEAVLFLPATHHVLRELDPGMVLGDELAQELVDRVARPDQRALILLGRIVPLHDAEVGGAGPDVDDQGVQQGLDAVGHRERFGDDDQTVDHPLHDLPAAAAC